MSREVLILRPLPGAQDTARRAQGLGLAPVVAPLFEIVRVDWAPPDAARFDAVMLTSANATRTAGLGLAAFRHLPAYAVGEASAAAATAAGFADVRTGPADGIALAAMMAAAGVALAFHPRGADTVAIPNPGFAIESAIVYSAEPVGTLPEAASEALRRDALALLHSPRSGAHFAALAAGFRPTTRIAAVSEAAAAAAGPGWRECHIAPVPRDHALLELAAKLCKNQPT